MISGDKTYIWQLDEWSHWHYDARRLSTLLAQVHHQQGYLLGRMADMGENLRNLATLQALSDDVIKSSEIEGELLNHDTVRIFHRAPTGCGCWGFDARRPERR